MADFNVRSDSVNVEQIMEQIRARIREKRGVDYTEQQIQRAGRGQAGEVPRPARRALRPARAVPPGAAAVDAARLPNYVFEETTLFETHRAPIRWIRRLLQPILKLFFNPNPLIQALHIQSQLNTMRRRAEAERDAARRASIS